MIHAYVECSESAPEHELNSNIILKHADYGLAVKAFGPECAILCGYDTHMGGFIMIVHEKSLVTSFKNKNEAKISNRDTEYT